MPFFAYKVIEATGQIRAAVEAFPYNNAMSVSTHLERQGATVINVRPLPKLLGALLSGAQRVRTRGVGRGDVADFLANLAVMVRAGIPLMSALQDSVDEHLHPELKRVVMNMTLIIESGSSMAEVAAQYPSIFPHTVVHLIRIGEETGTIDQALDKAASHLRRLDQIYGDAKRALMYPSFVLVTMAFAVAFWFWFVVPQLMDLFAQMQVELPAITRGLIATSEFLVTNTAEILFAIAALVLVLRFATLRFRGFRRLVHRALLHVPVVGRIIRSFNMAYVGEYLALLINSGVDIHRSLGLLSESIRNEVYREKLASIHDGLVRGAGLAAEFRRTKVFPPFANRMIDVGEQSGTLPAQLDYIAEEYRKRLNLLLETIGKVIEPFALVVAGGLFALIIASLFFPIYKLISSVI